MLKPHSVQCYWCEEAGQEQEHQSQTQTGCEDVEITTTSQSQSALMALIEVCTHTYMGFDLGRVITLSDSGHTQ